MANRKIENLLEVYSNISMAREIAHATLLELSNNMDENNDRYIVLGVIDQLKIIGEALELFDETMTVKSNVTNDTPDIYNLIIPGLFEPPVRTLRATIPENESHIFR